MQLRRRLEQAAAISAEAMQHYNVGVELEAQGRLQEALAEYDEAIHHNPKFAPAYNNRGNCNLHLGRPQQAIEDYDKAIGLDAQDPLSHMNRGIANANLGQFQR